MTEPLRSFREFWPHYLREHSDPRTRAVHYAGTSLGLAFVLAAAAARDWRWLLGAPVAGYGFAWFAHFRLERNRPATFEHPLWSLAGDFRMLYLWATRRLDAELRRALPR